MKNRIIATSLIILMLIISILYISELKKDFYSKKEKYESQNYSSYLLNFDYYYSMDLFTYENLIKDIIYDEGTISNKTLGKLDLMKMYSDIYLKVVHDGQESLENEVISEEEYQKLSEFLSVRAKHINYLYENFTNKKIFYDKEKFLKLSKDLRDLNISIEDIDNNKEYLKKLENVTLDIENLMTTIKN